MSEKSKEDPQPDEPLQKPDDISDKDWENMGKPDDEVEYDENEQPYRP